MKRFLHIILFIFLFFQGFSQQKDTLSKIESINTTIDNISSLCLKYDTVCIIDTFSGFAWITNRFGLHAKKYKDGNYIKTSTFYLNKIFLYKQFWDFNIKQGKLICEESYYFLDNSLVKYEKVDSIISKNINESKLNHRIILYFDHKVNIKKDIVINDNYKVDNKEINRILDFSDSFTKVIIR